MCIHQTNNFAGGSCIFYKLCQLFTICSFVACDHSYCPVVIPWLEDETTVKRMEISKKMHPHRFSKYFYEFPRLI